MLSDHCALRRSHCFCTLQGPFPRRFYGKVCRLYRSMRGARTHTECKNKLRHDCRRVHPNRSLASLHYSLQEAKMTKLSFTFDRRTLLRTSTGMAASAAALSLALPKGSRAETGGQAETSQTNGSGFYRFKVGDFQATVISDGYGSVPLGPIFAPNASEVDFKAMLKANFIEPMIQGTSNILV